tara:strand:- start:652 stop:1500 length:849 start_codon:yes stop_codon:yes gene_type:complete
MTTSKTKKSSSGLNNFRTPLRYPGGKSRAVSKLYNWFPKGMTEYREPFLGGGSMAIYLTKNHHNLKIWVNDLYEPVANFWIELRDETEYVYKQLQELKSRYPDPASAKGLFLDAKSQVNDGTLDPKDRAVAFYILNKCSFSGLSESSSFSKQASDSNFSMRGIEKLPHYGLLIKNWKITNLSYQELMGGDGAVIYLDPPYEIGSNLYGKKGAMHADFDHDKFAAICGESEQQLIVSYNNSQLVRDRFKRFQVGEFDLTYTMRSVGNYMSNQKERKELVLTNY